MNDLSCGTWAQLSFVMSQCRRMTDRQTDRKALQYRELHYMQWHSKTVAYHGTVTLR